MKNLFFYAVVAITFLSCTVSEPKNGEEVIASMHEKYKNDWYKTLTFKQATIYYNQKGEIAKEQTWLEAMQLPNNLAIKYDSVSSNNGIVFKNNQMHSISNGEVVASREVFHSLLILGFAVYTQNPQKTIDELTKLKIDLSKIKTAHWQGKENYVIGDETETHFYIEKDRMLFTKIVQKGRNNAVSETQFNKYQPLQNGWISPEVLFFTNGKMTMKEIYSEIKTPVLDVAIFDENEFVKARW